MSLSSALEVLANYRTNNTRASQDIFDKGTVVLRAGGTVKLGHEGTSIKHVSDSKVEQLAIPQVGNFSNSSRWPLSISAALILQMQVMVSLFVNART